MVRATSKSIDSSITGNDSFIEHLLIMIDTLRRKSAPLLSGLAVGAALWTACTPRSVPEAARAMADEVSQVTRSHEGMVVTSSALATAVGVRILEAGGNAIDAAVAAGFALAVVEPSMSGIGGRAQWLIHQVDGEFYGIDGTTQVPAGYPVDEIGDERLSSGYGMIGIPGVVAAHTKALAEHGTLPLAEVMAPAIALAEDGFVLGAAEAERIASTAAALRLYDGSRRHFLKSDGLPYEAGDRFVQPALARTLRAIARGGSEVFYHGAIAERIVADMRANGGYVTAHDLAEYRVLPSKVVRGSYRDYGLVATWLPAAGATTIEILQILDHFDLSAMSPAEWAGTVGLALRLGFEDFEWSWTAGDQAASIIVSRERAAARAELVRLPVPTASPVRSRPSLREEYNSHTTHLSVVDRDGRAVALTQTVGPTMGSKVVTPELGFVYAATMGYLGRTPPGVRAISAISPLILLRDREPVYVLGAAGARRIITAIVETVSRAIDQGLPLDEAMAAPRLHPSGSDLVLEDRGDTTWAGQVGELEAWGFGTRLNSSASYFGRIHGVYRDPRTGELMGVADPRRDGVAAAPQR